MARLREADYNYTVKSCVQVASPPAKPLLLYDGGCSFCAFWVHRWRRATGERVEYVPFQDPRVAAQFPEIPPAQCESAVQLIQPDGSVYSAAEAVFRAVALNPHGRWLLDWYRHSPAFAGLAESCYRLVARRRALLRNLSSPARSMLSANCMKAVSDTGKRARKDYYTSTLAPIGRRHEIRFSVIDAVIMSVLFLEVAGLMRLLLAK